MEKEFIIKYEMTLADFEAFNLYVTSKAYHKSRVSRYVIGGILLLAAAHAYYRTGFTVSIPMLLFIFLAFFWVVALPYLGLCGVKKRSANIVKSARPGAITGHREMTFTAKHILLKSDLFDETIQWGAIMKVETSKDHVMVFLTDLGAYVIPIKEIEGDYPATEFVSFVEAEISKSLNKDEIAAHLIK